MRRALVREVVFVRGRPRRRTRMGRVRSGVVVLVSLVVILWCWLLVLENNH